jgi:hypothetical protein
LEYLKVEPSSLVTVEPSPPTLNSLDDGPRVKLELETVGVAKYAPDDVEEFCTTLVLATRANK